jgi:hypothetical protein
MAEEPKTIWGKLAIITSLLTALVALGTLLKQCSVEDSPVPAVTTTVPSSPTYPVPDASYSPATPQYANYCCDVFGNRRCILVEPVPVGSPCFCLGQGEGVACP